VATAGERAGLLAPHVNEARAQVADLTARIAAAEQDAHAAFVAADAEAGQAASARAVALRGQLHVAQGHLDAMVRAEQVVSGEHQREQLEARLASLEAALADASESVARELATVRPAMGAAKRAIQSAQAAEQQANRIDAERRQVEVALGVREQARWTPTHNQVTALLGERPLLQQLLNHPEF
jgi:chromosome segregation ATPase